MILLSGCGKGKESPTAPASSVAPTANYTRTPTSGAPPLLVQFTDTSTPGSAAITAWSWDFGDGGTSTQQNPSHTYTTDGTFAVSLTVTTSVGSNTKATPSSVVVTTTLNQAAVNQVVQAAGLYAPTTPVHDLVTGTDPPRIENGFRVITEHHDAAERVPKITDLGRNDAILWPGALIQGKPNDLEQFRYVPVSGVFRNPEVLSINFLNASTAPVTKTVDNPTLSSVTQGINDLLSTAITAGSTYPARASFEKARSTTSKS